MKIKAARNSIETDSSGKENTAVNANTAAGEEKTFLGTEPIGRLLFKLAVPTVIAQLVNMLYNIVDRIYIGHMPGDGSAALTGVGVCMPLILIVSAFAAFVASGGAPRASISMGKGDYDSAEKILGGCVLMQVVISAVLTVVLLVFGRDLLLAFGASENTIDYAADYMSIYAIGTLFVQLTLGLNAFITCLSAPLQISCSIRFLFSVSKWAFAARHLQQSFRRGYPAYGSFCSCAGEKRF